MIGLLTKGRWGAEGEQRGWRGGCAGSCGEDVAPTLDGFQFKWVWMQQFGKSFVKEEPGQNHHPNNTVALWWQVERWDAERRGTQIYRIFHWSLWMTLFSAVKETQNTKSLCPLIFPSGHNGTILAIFNLSQIPWLWVRLCQSAMNDRDLNSNLWISLI